MALPAVGPSADAFSTKSLMTSMASLPKVKNEKKYCALHMLELQVANSVEWGSIEQTDLVDCKGFIAIDDLNLASV